MVSKSPEPPTFFSSLGGVIGVHGGAFANVHACPAGMPVVEIMSPTEPRWCYAALSTAKQLAYYAYYPHRFPSRYACPAAQVLHAIHCPSGATSTACRVEALGSLCEKPSPPCYATWRWPPSLPAHPRRPLSLARPPGSVSCARAPTARCIWTCRTF